MGEKPLKSLQEKKRRSAEEASGDRKQHRQSACHSLLVALGGHIPSLTLG